MYVGVKLGSKPKGLIRNGLVAEYRFNEGSGQTLTDNSGNNNHGTIGSTGGADANDPTWTGQGLSFVTDDYIDISNSSSLNISSQISLEFVFKVNTLSIAHYLLAKNLSASTDVQYGAYVDTTGILIFAGNGVFRNQPGAANQIAAGNWYHGIITVTAAETKFYVNGVFIGTTTGVTLAASNNSITFGKRKPGSVHLNGDIAISNIYNRQLSDAECQKNYKYYKQKMAQRGINI